MSSTYRVTHIQPEEILSLVDTARETTSKLNDKIKTSTFNYFSPAVKNSSQTFYENEMIQSRER